MPPHPKDLTPGCRSQHSQRSQNNTSNHVNHTSQRNATNSTATNSIPNSTGPGSNQTKKHLNPISTNFFPQKPKLKAQMIKKQHSTLTILSPSFSTSTSTQNTKPKKLRAKPVAKGPDGQISTEFQELATRLKESLKKANKHKAYRSIIDNPNIQINDTHSFFKQRGSSGTFGFLDGPNFDNSTLPSSRLHPDAQFIKDDSYTHRSQLDSTGISKDYMDMIKLHQEQHLQNNQFNNSFDHNPGLEAPKFDDAILQHGAFDRASKRIIRFRNYLVKNHQKRQKVLGFRRISVLHSASTNLGSKNLSEQLNNQNDIDDNNFGHIDNDFGIKMTTLNPSTSLDSDDSFHISPLTTPTPSPNTPQTPNTHLDHTHSKNKHLDNEHTPEVSLDARDLDWLFSTSSASSPSRAFLHFDNNDSLISAIRTLVVPADKSTPNQLFDLVDRNSDLNDSPGFDNYNNINEFFTTKRLPWANRIHENYQRHDYLKVLRLFELEHLPLLRDYTEKLWVVQQLVNNIINNDTKQGKFIEGSQKHGDLGHFVNVLDNVLKQYPQFYDIIDLVMPPNLVKQYKRIYLEFYRNKIHTEIELGEGNRGFKHQNDPNYENNQNGNDYHFEKLIKQLSQNNISPLHLYHPLLLPSSHDVNDSITLNDVVYNSTVDQGQELYHSKVKTAFGHFYQGTSTPTEYRELGIKLRLHPHDIDILVQDLDSQILSPNSLDQNKNKMGKGVGLIGQDGIVDGKNTNKAGDHDSDMHNLYSHYGGVNDNGTYDPFNVEKITLQNGQNTQDQIQTRSNPVRSHHPLVAVNGDGNVVHELYLHPHFQKSVKIYDFLQDTRHHLHALIEDLQSSQDITKLNTEFHQGFEEYCRNWVKDDNFGHNSDDFERFDSVLKQVKHVYMNDPARKFNNNNRKNDPFQSLLDEKKLDIHQDDDFLTKMVKKAVNFVDQTSNPKTNHNIYKKIANLDNSTILELMLHFLQDELYMFDSLLSLNGLEIQEFQNVVHFDVFANSHSLRILQIEQEQDSGDKKIGPNDIDGNNDIIHKKVFKINKNVLQKLLKLQIKKRTIESKSFFQETINNLLSKPLDLTVDNLQNVDLWSDNLLNSIDNNNNNIDNFNFEQNLKQKFKNNQQLIQNNPHKSQQLQNSLKPSIPETLPSDSLPFLSTLNSLSTHHIINTSPRLSGYVKRYLSSNPPDYYYDIIDHLHSAQHSTQHSTPTTSTVPTRNTTNQASIIPSTLSFAPPTPIDPVPIMSNMLVFPWTVQDPKMTQMLAIAYAKVGMTALSKQVITSHLKGAYITDVTSTRIDTGSIDVLRREHADIVKGFIGDNGNGDILNVEKIGKGKKFGKNGGKKNGENVLRSLRLLSMFNSIESPKNVIDLVSELDDDDSSLITHTEYLGSLPSAVSGIPVKYLKIANFVSNFDEREHLLNKIAKNVQLFQQLEDIMQSLKQGEKVNDELSIKLKKFEDQIDQYNIDIEIVKDKHNDLIEQLGFSDQSRQRMEEKLDQIQQMEQNSHNSQNDNETQIGNNLHKKELKNQDNLGQNDEMDELDSVDVIQTAQKLNILNKQIADQEDEREKKFKKQFSAKDGEFPIDDQNEKNTEKNSKISLQNRHFLLHEYLIDILDNDHRMLEYLYNRPLRLSPHLVIHLDSDTDLVDQIDGKKKMDKNSHLQKIKTQFKLALGLYSEVLPTSPLHNPYNMSVSDDNEINSQDIHNHIHSLHTPLNHSIQTHQDLIDSDQIINEVIDLVATNPEGGGNNAQNEPLDRQTQANLVKNYTLQQRRYSIYNRNGDVNTLPEVRFQPTPQSMLTYHFFTAKKLHFFLRSLLNQSHYPIRQLGHDLLQQTLFQSNGIMTQAHQISKNVKKSIQLFENNFFHAENTDKNRTKVEFLSRHLHKTLSQRVNSHLIKTSPNLFHNTEKQSFEHVVYHLMGGQNDQNEYLNNQDNQGAGDDTNARIGDVYHKKRPQNGGLFANIPNVGVLGDTIDVLRTELTQIDIIRVIQEGCTIIDANFNHNNGQLLKKNKNDQNKHNFAKKNDTLHDVLLPNDDFSQQFSSAIETHSLSAMSYLLSIDPNITIDALISSIDDDNSKISNVLGEMYSNNDSIDENNYSSDFKRVIQQRFSSRRDGSSKVLNDFSNTIEKISLPLDAWLGQHIKSHSDNITVMYRTVLDGSSTQQFGGNKLSKSKMIELQDEVSELGDELDEISDNEDEVGGIEQNMNQENQENQEVIDKFDYIFLKNPHYNANSSQHTPPVFTIPRVFFMNAVQNNVKKLLLLNKNSELLLQCRQIGQNYTDVMNSIKEYTPLLERYIINSTSPEYEQSDYQKLNSKSVTPFREKIGRINGDLDDSHILSLLAHLNSLNNPNVDLFQHGMGQFITEKRLGLSDLTLNLILGNTNSHNHKNNHHQNTNLNDRALRLAIELDSGMVDLNDVGDDSFERNALNSSRVAIYDADYVNPINRLHVWSKLSFQDTFALFQAQNVQLDEPVEKLQSQYLNNKMNKKALLNTLGYHPNQALNMFLKNTYGVSDLDFVVNGVVEGADNVGVDLTQDDGDNNNNNNNNNVDVVMDNDLIPINSRLQSIATIQLTPPKKNKQILNHFGSILNKQIEKSNSKITISLPIYEHLNNYFLKKLIKLKKLDPQYYHLKNQFQNQGARFGQNSIFDLENNIKLISTSLLTSQTPLLLIPPSVLDIEMGHVGNHSANNYTTYQSQLSRKNPKIIDEIVTRYKHNELVSKIQQESYDSESISSTPPPSFESIHSLLPSLCPRGFGKVGDYIFDLNQNGLLPHGSNSLLSLLESKQLQSIPTELNSILYTLSDEYMHQIIIGGRNFKKGVSFYARNDYFKMSTKILSSTIYTLTTQLTPSADNDELIVNMVSQLFGMVRNSEGEFDQDSVTILNSVLLQNQFSYKNKMVWNNILNIITDSIQNGQKKQQIISPFSKKFINSLSNSSLFHNNDVDTPTGEVLLSNIVDFLTHNLDNKATPTDTVGKILQSNINTPINVRYGPLYGLSLTQILQPLLKIGNVSKIVQILAKFEAKKEQNLDEFVQVLQRDVSLSPTMEESVHLKQIFGDISHEDLINKVNSNIAEYIQGFLPPASLFLSKKLPKNTILAPNSDQNDQNHIDLDPFSALFDIFQNPQRISKYLPAINNDQSPDDDDSLFPPTNHVLDYALSPNLTFQTSTRFSDVDSDTKASFGYQLLNTLSKLEASMQTHYKLHVLPYRNTISRTIIPSADSKINNDHELLDAIIHAMNPDNLFKHSMWVVDEETGRKVLNKRFTAFVFANQVFPLLYRTGVVHVSGSGDDVGDVGDVGELNNEDGTVVQSKVKNWFQNASPHPAIGDIDTVLNAAIRVHEDGLNGNNGEGLIKTDQLVDLLLAVITTKQQSNVPLVKLSPTTLSKVQKTITSTARDVLNAQKLHQMNQINTILDGFNLSKLTKLNEILQIEQVQLDFIQNGDVSEANSGKRNTSLGSFYKKHAFCGTILSKQSKSDPTGVVGSSQNNGFSRSNQYKNGLSQEHGLDELINGVDTILNGKNKNGEVIVIDQQDISFNDTKIVQIEQLLKLLQATTSINTEDDVPDVIVYSNRLVFNTNQIDSIVKPRTDKPDEENNVIINSVKYFPTSLAKLVKFLQTQDSSQNNGGNVDDLLFFIDPISLISAASTVHNQSLSSKFKNSTNGDHIQPSTPSFNVIYPYLEQVNIDPSLSLQNGQKSDKKRSSVKHFELTLPVKITYLAQKVDRFGEDINGDNFDEKVSLLGKNFKKRDGMFNQNETNELLSLSLVSPKELSTSNNTENAFTTTLSINTRQIDGLPCFPSRLINQVDQYKGEKMDQNVENALPLSNHKKPNNELLFIPIHKSNSSGSKFILRNDPSWLNNTDLMSKMPQFDEAVIKTIQNDRELYKNPLFTSLSLINKLILPYITHSSQYNKQNIDNTQFSKLDEELFSTLFGSDSLHNDDFFVNFMKSSVFESKQISPQEMVLKKYISALFKTLRPFFTNFTSSSLSPTQKLVHMINTAIEIIRQSGKIHSGLPQVTTLLFSAKTFLLDLSFTLKPTITTIPNSASGGSILDAQTSTDIQFERHLAFLDDSIITFKGLQSAKFELLNENSKIVQKMATQMDKAEAINKLVLTGAKKKQDLTQYELFLLNSLNNGFIRNDNQFSGQISLVLSNPPGELLNNVKKITQIDQNLKSCFDSFLFLSKKYQITPISTQMSELVDIAIGLDPISVDNNHTLIRKAVGNKNGGKNDEINPQEAQMGVSNPNQDYKISIKTTGAITQQSFAFLPLFHPKLPKLTMNHKTLQNSQTQSPETSQTLLDFDTAIDIDIESHFHQQLKQNLIQFENGDDIKTTFNKWLQTQLSTGQITRTYLLTSKPTHQISQLVSQTLQAIEGAHTPDLTRTTISTDLLSPLDNLTMAGLSVSNTKENIPTVYRVLRSKFFANQKKLKALSQLATDVAGSHPSSTGGVSVDNANSSSVGQYRLTQGLGDLSQNGVDVKLDANGTVVPLFSDVYKVNEFAFTLTGSIVKQLSQHQALSLKIIANGAKIRENKGSSTEGEQTISVDQDIITSSLLDSNISDQNSLAKSIVKSQQTMLGLFFYAKTNNIPLSPPVLRILHKLIQSYKSTGLKRQANASDSAVISLFGVNIDPQNGILGTHKSTSLHAQLLSSLSTPVKHLLIQHAATESDQDDFGPNRSPFQSNPTKHKKRNGIGSLPCFYLLADNFHGSEVPLPNETSSSNDAVRYTPAVEHGMWLKHIDSVLRTAPDSLNKVEKPDPNNPLRSKSAHMGLVPLGPHSTMQFTRAVLGSVNWGGISLVGLQAEKGILLEHGQLSAYIGANHVEIMALWNRLFQHCDNTDDAMKKVQKNDFEHVPIVQKFFQNRNQNIASIQNMSIHDTWVHYLGEHYADMINSLVMTIKNGQNGISEADISTLTKQIITTYSNIITTTLDQPVIGAIDLKLLSKEDDEKNNEAKKDAKFEKVFKKFASKQTHIMTPLFISSLQTWLLETSIRSESGDFQNDPNKPALSTHYLFANSQNYQVANKNNLKTLALMSALNTSYTMQEWNPQTVALAIMKQKRVNKAAGNGPSTPEDVYLSQISTTINHMKHHSKAVRGFIGHVAGQLGDGIETGEFVGDLGGLLLTQLLVENNGYFFLPGGQIQTQVQNDKGKNVKNGKNNKKDTKHGENLPGFNHDDIIQANNPTTINGNTIQNRAVHLSSYIRSQILQLPTSVDKIDKTEDKTEQTRQISPPDQDTQNKTHQKLTTTKQVKHQPLSVLAPNLNVIKTLSLLPPSDLSLTPFTASAVQQSPAQTIQTQLYRSPLAKLRSNEAKWIDLECQNGEIVQINEKPNHNHIQLTNGITHVRDIIYQLDAYRRYQENNVEIFKNISPTRTVFWYGQIDEKKKSKQFDKFNFYRQNITNLSQNNLSNLGTVLPLNQISTDFLTPFFNPNIRSKLISFISNGYQVNNMNVDQYDRLTQPIPNEKGINDEQKEGLRVHRENGPVHSQINPQNNTHTSQSSLYINKVDFYTAEVQSALQKLTNGLIDTYITQASLHCVSTQLGNILKSQNDQNDQNDQNNQNDLPQLDTKITAMNLFLPHFAIILAKNNISTQNISTLISHLSQTKLFQNSTKKVQNRSLSDSHYFHELSRFGSEYTTEKILNQNKETSSPNKTEKNKHNKSKPFSSSNPFLSSDQITQVPSLLELITPTHQSTTTSTYSSNKILHLSLPSPSKHLLDSSQHSLIRFADNLDIFTRRITTGGTDPSVQTQTVSQSVLHTLNLVNMTLSSVTPFEPIQNQAIGGIGTENNLGDGENAENGDTNITDAIAFAVKKHSLNKRAQLLALYQANLISSILFTTYQRSRSSPVSGPLGKYKRGWGMKKWLKKQPKSIDSIFISYLPYLGSSGQLHETRLKKKGLVLESDIVSIGDVNETSGQQVEENVEIGDIEKSPEKPPQTDFSTLHLAASTLYALTHTLSTTPFQSQTHPDTFSDMDPLTMAVNGVDLSTQKQRQQTSNKIIPTSQYDPIIPSDPSSPIRMAHLWEAEYSDENDKSVNDDKNNPKKSKNAPGRHHTILAPGFTSALTPLVYPHDALDDLAFNIGGVTKLYKKSKSEQDFTQVQSNFSQQFALNFKTSNRLISRKNDGYQYNPLQNVVSLPSDFMNQNVSIPAYTQGFIAKMLPNLQSQNFSSFAWLNFDLSVEEQQEHHEHQEHRKNDNKLVRNNFHKHKFEEYSQLLQNSTIELIIHSYINTTKSLLTFNQYHAATQALTRATVLARKTDFSQRQRHFESLFESLYDSSSGIGMDLRRSEVNNVNNANNVNGGNGINGIDGYHSFTSILYPGFKHGGLGKSANKIKHSEFNKGQNEQKSNIVQSFATGTDIINELRPLFELSPDFVQNSSHSDGDYIDLDNFHTHNDQNNIFNKNSQTINNSPQKNKKDQIIDSIKKSLFLPVAINPLSPLHSYNNINITHPTNPTMFNITNSNPLIYNANLELISHVLAAHWGGNHRNDNTAKFPNFENPHNLAQNSPESQNSPPKSPVLVLKLDQSWSKGFTGANQDKWTHPIIGDAIVQSSGVQNKKQLCNTLFSDSRSDLSHDNNQSVDHMLLSHAVHSHEYQ